MNYYEILLKTVPQLLSYQSEEKIPVGSLVQVSLGKQQVNGVIIHEVQTPEYQCVTIQNVHVEAAVSAEQIELCQWMSTYYYASLRRCIQLFIPSVIWNQKTVPKRECFLELAIKNEKALEICKRAKKQCELIKVLHENGKTDENIIKKDFSTNIIKTLLEKEIIKRTEGELLNPDLNHSVKAHHNQPLTEEQQKVLEAILSKSSQKQRSLKESKKLDTVDLDLRPSFLLHGITGSGKTEVYLQIIKENIENGLQTVLLVPEIGLTTELIQHFTEHFPTEISIIHSNLSDRERVQAWHRIHQGETKLILGSRSALFTPWKALGAIIVDEEHEWTYKQEASPRYHVKKVAMELTRLFGDLSTPSAVQRNPVEMENKQEEMGKALIKVILGSATPSIESYYEHSSTNHGPQTTDFRLLTMKHRTNNAKLPPIHLVDLREEYQKKNYSMYSELLQAGISSRLEKKEQVILFLNKRGSSSSVTCRDCGFTPYCQDCDISMTFHSKLKDFHGGGLICHYCGRFEDNMSNCPDCKSAAIRYFGTGTQKAEQQLQELFPEARILRADKDTTSGKYDFEEIYHKMLNNEADILLGTQMIAKGLDLPNVTLTGVLLADIGLHVPDFRSSERVFQLLTQVAGRSGRHKPGEVIIQSYQPDHPALQATKNYDYEGFYEEELKHREILNYAPFSKGIKLIFGHENAMEAEKEAIHLYGKLQDIVRGSGTVNLFSPKNPNNLKNHNNPTIELAPNYISKLHGKYLWNILIRSKNPREVLNSISLPKGWKIDVDPM
jgi:primosomal protein N' (replication factor Y)